MKEFMSPDKEKVIGPQMSQSDYEKIGERLLKVDSSMAKAYLHEAGISEEEIAAKIAAAPKLQEKKKALPPLADGEKAEMFAKMAAEYEEQFQKNGKQEYLDLAKTCRREAERLVKESE